MSDGGASDGHPLYGDDSHAVGRRLLGPGSVTGIADNDLAGLVTDIQAGAMGSWWCLRSLFVANTFTAGADLTAYSVAACAVSKDGARAGRVVAKVLALVDARSGNIELIAREYVSFVGRTLIRK